MFPTSSSITTIPPFPRPGPKQSSTLSSVLWDTETCSTYYPVTYGIIYALPSLASCSFRRSRALRHWFLFSHRTNGYLTQVQHWILQGPEKSILYLCPGLRLRPGRLCLINSTFERGLHLFHNQVSKDESISQLNPAA